MQHRTLNLPLVCLSFLPLARTKDRRLVKRRYIVPWRSYGTESRSQRHPVRGSPQSKMSNSSPLLLLSLNLEEIPRPSTTTPPPTSRRAWRRWAPPPRCHPFPSSLEQEGPKILSLYYPLPQAQESRSSSSPPQVPSTPSRGPHQSSPCRRWTLPSPDLAPIGLGLEFMKIL